MMAHHNANTLRAIPTFRPAWMVFGPSATDRLIGDLRRALASRLGYADMTLEQIAVVAPGSET